jgi:hypothetical protein
MFDDTPSLPLQEADDASISISIDDESRGGQRRHGPLKEAANYLANAIQTEELRNELDVVAADCTELRERITADLQQARNKITQAILDIRRGVAPAIGSLAGSVVSSQVEKAAGYVDRIVSGRSENVGERTPTD